MVCEEEGVSGRKNERKRAGGVCERDNVCVILPMFDRGVREVVGCMCVREMTFAKVGGVRGKACVVEVVASI